MNSQWIELLCVCVIFGWCGVYFYAHRSLRRSTLNFPVAMVGGVEITMQSGDPFQGILNDAGAFESPGDYPPQEAQRQLYGTCTAIEAKDGWVSFVLQEHPGARFVSQAPQLVQCFISHCKYSLPCLRPGDKVTLAVFLCDEDPLEGEVEVDWCMVQHQKPLIRGGDHE